MKLFDFIAKSPEAYHTVATMEEELQAQGYERLYEDNVWHLPNEKYYVVRGDSSIIAFRLPGKMPEGFHIVAAHTDSPAFKIKEHPEVDVEKHYIKLNTEKYGGMLMSSWLIESVAEFINNRPALKIIFCRIKNPCWCVPISNRMLSYILKIIP